MTPEIKRIDYAESAYEDIRVPRQAVIDAVIKICEEAGLRVPEPETWDLFVPKMTGDPCLVRRVK